jgi:hypothetical protein
MNCGLTLTLVLSLRERKQVFALGELLDRKAGNHWTLRGIGILPMIYPNHRLTTATPSVGGLEADATSNGYMISLFFELHVRKRHCVCTGRLIHL